MILLGGVIVSLTGCNNNFAQQETKVFSIDIDGNNLFYDEDCEDAAAIKSSAEGFTIAAMGRNYYKPDVKAETEYYSETLKEYFTADDWIDNDNAYIVKNKLMMSVEELNMESIQLVRIGGEGACIVDYTYVLIVENSTSDFFSGYEIKNGTSYETAIQLKMLRQQGEWKIDEYSIERTEEIN